jgi:hypothetical protein
MEAAPRMRTASFSSGDWKDRPCQPELFALALYIWRNMVEIPSGRTLDVDFMFTKLIVEDIETSATFYTSVFGLVEMHRIEARIMERPVTEVVYMPTYSGGPMFILACCGRSLPNMPFWAVQSWTRRN